MSSWVVVMAKPNCENLAVHNLERQGFRSYLPRFRQTRPDKTIMIRPLFPRYLFSLIDVSWYPILGTYGVSYVLTGENGPLDVPNSVIETIKAKEGPDGLICLDKADVRFKKGDKVRAIEGPLTGRILIYDGMSARDRVRVLINMLGSQVHGTIHEQALVAA